MEAKDLVSEFYKEIKMSDKSLWNYEIPEEITDEVAIEVLEMQITEIDDNAGELWDSYYEKISMPVWKHCIKALKERIGTR